MAYNATNSKRAMEAAASDGIPRRPSCCSASAVRDTPPGHCGSSVHVGINLSDIAGEKIAAGDRSGNLDDISIWSPMTFGQPIVTSWTITDGVRSYSFDRPGGIGTLELGIGGGGSITDWKIGVVDGTGLSPVMVFTTHNSSTETDYSGKAGVWASTASTRGEWTFGLEAGASTPEPRAIATAGGGRAVLVLFALRRRVVLQ